MIQLAHDHGARLRVALNTDIDPTDHSELMRKVEAYASRGVDGFIMKSEDAMREVHARFPEITVHASVSRNVRDRAAMVRIKRRSLELTLFVAEASGQRPSRSRRSSLAAAKPGWR